MWTSNSREIHFRGLYWRRAIVNLKDSFMDSDFILLPPNPLYNIYRPIRQWHLEMRSGGSLYPGTKCFSIKQSQRMPAFVFQLDQRC
jgi:hypothetical protein